MNSNPEATRFGDTIDTPQSQAHHSQQPTPKQTPKQTPTSAVFPSPLLETPKHNQGQFSDSGNWTPRFAEDYSVFNSTPGNLRGSDGPFADFAPATPTSSGEHQRLISAEQFAVEIAAHVNHFSQDSTRPFPPVDPSRRLSSSPRLPHLQPDQSTESIRHPVSHTQKQSKTPTRAHFASHQIATPPLTAQKKTRSLRLATTMQNDESFGQTDFSDPQHQNDMAAMMVNPGDLFAYPMSAPVTGPTSFWDPSAHMAMDMDFSTQTANMFQTAGPPQQNMGSFDWNSGLFSQLSGFPPPQHDVQPPSRDSAPPPRRERPLAPKPRVITAPAVTMAPQPPAGASFSGESTNVFGIVAPSSAVDPGLLSRPQTAVDTSFGMSGLDMREEVAESNGSSGGVRDARNGKLPDRAFASSLVKPLPRPGLGRSMSENRGKKSRGRNVSAGSGTTGRPLSIASGSGLDVSRSTQRGTGRISPLKKQYRLSGLASIPEINPQKARSRASVRFTIDSMGRARAETTVVADDSDQGPSLTRGRSTEDFSQAQDWPSEEDDDESSTDDEPIIIPNRGASFNASFALPDPRKPVGSIFHTSRRSVSDRSTSTQGTMDGLHGHLLDAESEAETVMNDQSIQGMDAMSELRRVAEQRQKRPGVGGRVSRYTSGSFGGHGGAISPTSLTDSSLGTDGGIRCVCHRNRGDESLGFMVQCESCEMWLHGKCINLTKRSMPRVYICAFCANTPNMRGGRMRDTSRASGLGIAPASSPLASRSFKSFR